MDEGIRFIVILFASLAGVAILSFLAVVILTNAEINRLNDIPKYEENVRILMEAIYLYRCVKCLKYEEYNNIDYCDVIEPVDFLKLRKKKRTIENMLPKEKFELIKPYLEQAAHNIDKRKV